MSKRALEVADQIESLVSDLNWKTGAMVGDEAALMARFDVGRSVFRQAIRLCEHLRVAAMRRGRTGGLVIVRPTAEPAALSLQIAWTKQRVPKRSTERLRAAVDNWATQGPTGSQVFAETVRMADDGFHTNGLTRIQALNSMKLGEQIALSILETLIDQRWEGPELLGSESRLMETYSAGRASLREAVHLLELHDAAVMQRGPGGGLLVLRAPSAGAIPRSLRAQLRFARLSDDQIVELCREFVSSTPAEPVQDAGLVLRQGAQKLINELTQNIP